MTIGIVVAMQSELDPFLVGKDYTTDKVGSSTVYSLDIAGKAVYITKLATVGEICSSASTQMLITKYGVDIILNFGVVGALSDSAKLCDVMLVGGVVHYDMDTSAIDNVPVGRYTAFDDIVIPTSTRLLFIAKDIAPHLPIVNCASGDKFVEDTCTKQHIATTFGCQICDMELAGIVITATLSGVEVLSVKAVSDSLIGGGGEFAQNLAKASQSYVQLVTAILERL